MYYNVAQLLKEPVGSTRAYDISETFTSVDGAIGVFPPGKLSLMRTDAGIWVHAELRVAGSAACSRCLQKFVDTLHVDMDEEYLPTVDVNSGYPLRVPEKDEGTFTIDQRHVLDLGAALLEYYITCQPMKPLCQKDCMGLCLLCGANKNEGLCRCPEEAPDERWSPLLHLLKRETSRISSQREG